MLPAARALLLLLYPAPAWAHASGEGLDAGVWYAIILTNLSLMTFFYVKGWKRRKRDQRAAGPLLLFILAVFSILLALLPPIDTLSDQLLSVHMVQHMLLMMVGAPLFVFAYLDYYIKMGLPAASRRFLWQVARRFVRVGFVSLSRPLIIAVLYALILWIWHVPMLYESALANKFIHNIQHLAFFICSFYFWKVLLRRVGRPALNPAAGIIYVFIASLHSAALGVLMAVSPEIWYKFYSATTEPFGLTALEDQQLAGYIMWMPAGVTYFLVAINLTRKLLVDPPPSDSSPAKGEISADPPIQSHI